MREMIAKFINDIKSAAGGDFLDGAGYAKSRQISFLNMAFMPLGIVVYLYRSFFRIAAVFALLISLLSFAVKAGYGCIYANQLGNYPFACDISLSMYAVYFLLRLLIVAVFLKVWYKTSLNGDNVDWRRLFVINTNDWKIFAVLVVFCLINALPLVSFLMLLERVPDPNWIVESIYFAVISSGLWLPFFALRFYSIIAFVVEEKPVPPLQEIYIRSSGNSLKMILAVALLMLLSVILVSNFGVLAFFVMEGLPFVGSILMDYAYNIIFLLIITVFFNYCLIQQNGLFCPRMPEEK